MFGICLLLMISVCIIHKLLESTILYICYVKTKEGCTVYVVLPRFISPKLQQFTNIFHYGGKIISMHLHTFVSMYFECLFINHLVDSTVRRWRTSHWLISLVCQCWETSTCLFPIEDWCKLTWSHVRHDHTPNHVQVAPPNLKWMENHKPLFKVATHSVTSIHPQVRCGHWRTSNVAKIVLKMWINLFILQMLYVFRLHFKIPNHLCCDACILEAVKYN